MPTYDYECGSCEHAFELFQSISEPAQKKCPRCGRKTLKRLFGTGAALIFKGSGFYQTDYRSESYKKGAEADKKSSDSGTSKNSESKSAESKSDTKPDSKPDTKSDRSSTSAKPGRKKAVART